MTLRERYDDDPEVAVGAAVLLVVAVVAALLILGVRGNPFTGEATRTVRATFASAQQLSVGDDVRVRGMRSGEVTDISLTAGGRLTRVTMDVETAAGDLKDDARATIQYKTVLGGAFYIDLEPGKSGRELPGGNISAARTQNQVEVDDVLDFAQGGAREGLRILPAEMADALRGENELRQLFDTVEAISPGAERGLNAVRGRQLDRDLQGLVVNTGRTLDALNAPTDRIKDVVEGGAATLRATAGRGDDIRRTLSLVPPTSTEVTATLARVRQTLDVADPLIDKLQRSANLVAPTFAVVRPTLSDADELLERARPLLQSLRPAARSLRTASRRALPLFTGLDPSIDRLEKRILPAVLAVDPVTEKPTSTMIGGAFAHLGSVAGQMDGQGHMLRFPVTSGSAPLASLPCQLYFNNPDSSELIACSSVNDALQSYLAYKPLSPLPGSADGGDANGGGR
ncbi:MAG: hypothetical protein JWR63_2956 [Conexibacter sp.]|nr:hypothetical protein [Conexibacter sp.]